MMPGMDGYEVAARLKGDAATRNIPVIMVTAQDGRNARLLGLEAGADDFLTKPVDRAELCVRVKNLLRLKAYGDEHDAYSHVLEGEIRSRTAELVESESLYRSTFDAAPVGIVQLGLDGRWWRVNQRLSAMTGFPREDLEGAGAAGLMQLDPPDAFTEALRQMDEGQLDRHVIEETRFRRRDDGFGWARVFFSLHRDAGGQPQHVIAVLDDITERRALEAQARQATKMDAIGRLASGVAHDFNNLLTVILTCADLIKDDSAIEDEHRQDLGEIVKAARSAAGLTRQLLAFGRQQVLQTAPLDVNALITEMAGMLGRLIDETVEVTLDLAPGLPKVLVDRGQLEQVVMNLVVNARDAMPAGGRVTLHTTDVDLDASCCQYEEEIVPGRYVALRVTDTGGGMTEETRRRLFEPFYTTKEIGKGTGLGLSTTYGIVKQSKGYIRVDSTLGQGATFTVCLPCASGDAPSAALRVASTALAALPSETVLIVEDDAVIRRLSKRTLADAGYVVLEAANGNEAETVFRDHAGAIALVVTDVIMPGCSGPELVRRLQARAPALRVLYMSGYSAQKTALPTGLDHSFPLLQKPFTAGEFKQHVRAALRS
jgi:PAS domain S-box-containing protein